MRIIAGEHRGRPLMAPPGRGTRPMLDRVREALFSTLGSACTDARVLDLYAGTGSLGLEALSRGAGTACMIERDPRVVAVLRRNVETLGLADRAGIRRGDALSERLWRAPGEPRFDLVFLDPPYPLWREARERAKLLAAALRVVAEHLEPGGRLVIHTPRGELSAADLEPCAARSRDYGTTAVWYVEQPGGDADADADPGPAPEETA